MLPKIYTFVNIKKNKKTCEFLDLFEVNCRDHN